MPVTSLLPSPFYSSLFLFNETATTEIYTLSLHDALPISTSARLAAVDVPVPPSLPAPATVDELLEALRRHNFSTDRKSTRLNSSHRCISYAVFCLKKKKKKTKSVDTTQTVIQPSE